MMNKFRKVTLVMISVLGIFLVALLLYFWMPKTNDLKYADSSNSLLYSYLDNIDICSLFNGKNEIVEVATRYSVLYKQDDARTMYVFSMPMRDIETSTYSTLNKSITHIYNNTYTTVNNDYKIDYKFDSVRIGSVENWFEIELDDIKSMNYMKDSKILNYSGEGIFYAFKDESEITVMPTNSGMIVKYQVDDYIDSLTFPIKIPKYRINNDEAGYVVLSEYGSDPDDIMANNYFVISRPIILNTNGDAKIDGSMFMEKIDEDYILNYNGCLDNQFPKTFIFTVNFYCENMFFDCAAYENKPKQNHIFDSYVVYDTTSNNQETNDYIKFNIRSFTPSDPEKLDKILLNLNVIYASGETEIEVYSVRYDWCSWLLNWQDKAPISEKIGEFKINGKGWHALDLTQYVKRLINDDYYSLENNSIMLKAKDGSNGYVIFASGDNSIYPPFFEVNYRV